MIQKGKQNLLLNTYLLNAIDSLQGDIIKSDAQVTRLFENRSRIFGGVFRKHHSKSSAMP
jgi:hypothetical protein